MDLLKSPFEVTMKLFLISQSTNDRYDALSSAVVIAATADAARNMNPFDGTPIDWSLEKENCWCKYPEDVSIKYLGEAAEGLLPGVVE